MLREIKPNEFSNAFELIGNDWMLITASAGGKTNTMTASWGGLGVLWGKNVATCFIRPQRYTFPIADMAKGLTLSFFDKEKKHILARCGSTSGREVDKIKENELTEINDSGYVYFEEAQSVILGKVIYKDVFDPKGFVDIDPDEWYKDKDYHHIFIMEIEKILKK